MLHYNILLIAKLLSLSLGYSHMNIISKFPTEGTHGTLSSEKTARHCFIRF